MTTKYDKITKRLQKIGNLALSDNGSKTSWNIEDTIDHRIIASNIPNKSIEAWLDGFETCHKEWIRMVKNSI